MLCTQLGTPQLRLATLVVGLLTTVFGCTDLLAQSNEFKQFNAPGIFQYRAFYDCDGASCAEDVSEVVNIEVFEQPEINIESDDVAVCIGVRQ